MFFRCPITSTPGHSVNRNRDEDSGLLLVVHHTDRFVFADSALLQLLNQQGRDRDGTSYPRRPGTDRVRRAGGEILARIRGERKREGDGGAGG